MSTLLQFEFTFTVNQQASLREIQTQVAALPDGSSIQLAEVEGTDVSVIAYKNIYTRGLGIGVVIGGKQYGAYGIQSVRGADGSMPVGRLVNTVIRNYIERWSTPERASAI